MTETTTTSPTTDRREALRQRIEASELRQQARNLGEQAKEAADSALGYAKKHPLRVVAGAVAVGLAIGALTRPGRRVGKRGGALAAIALDAALAYGMKAFDKAGTFGSEAADSAGVAARKIGRDASYRLDVAGDAVRAGSRKAGAIGTKAMRDMRSRFTH